MEQGFLPQRADHYSQIAINLLEGGTPQLGFHPFLPLLIRMGRGTLINPWVIKDPPQHPGGCVKRIRVLSEINQ